MPITDPPLPTLLGTLKESELFKDLTPDELSEIIIHLRMIRAQKGYEIIRQGDSWDSFYVILEGRVSVRIKKGMRTHKMGTLGKGEFFGEMALLTEQTRNATIMAEETSELLVLKKNEFDNILMKNPTRAQKIRKAYFDRSSKNRK